MSEGRHEPEGADALRELQRAAQRREELAAAYQQKARRYRREAREMRAVAAEIVRTQASRGE